MGNGISSNEKVAVDSNRNDVLNKRDKNSKSGPLLKNTDLINEINQPATVDQLNLSLLSCQLCKLFQNCPDAMTNENHTIDDLNVQIANVKQWKSSIKYNSKLIESKAVTGIVYLSSTSSSSTSFESPADIGMPFVVFEMSFVEFKELNSMKVARITTKGTNAKAYSAITSDDVMFKIGKAGDIFIKSYEKIRVTGLLDWVKDVTVKTSVECLITGHGMGGALSSLMMAEMAVNAYRKRVGGEVHKVVGNKQDSSRKDVDFDESSLKSHQNSVSLSNSISYSASNRSGLSDGTFAINPNSEINEAIDDNELKDTWLQYYLVTFGSPRVFSKPTAEKLARIGLNDRILRFINVGDPLPSYLDRHSQYGHMGTAFAYEATDDLKYQKFVCVNNEVEYDGFDQISQTIGCDEEVDITAALRTMTDSDLKASNGASVLVPNKVRIAHSLDSYLINLQTSLDCQKLDTADMQSDDYVGDEKLFQFKPKPKPKTNLFTPTGFVKFIRESSFNLSFR